MGYGRFARELRSLQINIIYLMSSRLRIVQLATDAMNRLNKVTGFDRINHLKRQVSAAESLYAQHRSQLTQLRNQHSQLVADRSQCAKDINSLLQRKHQWQPQDVGRFTELYAKEHGLESQELSMRTQLSQMEARVERSHDSLMSAMTERYREELLWSDNVRSISSYGTLALMMVNLVMFAAVHGWLEPRRRLRMQQSLLEAMQPQQQQLLTCGQGEMKETAGVNAFELSPVQLDLISERIYERLAKSQLGILPVQTAVSDQQGEEEMAVMIPGRDVMTTSRLGVWEWLDHRRMDYKLTADNTTLIILMSAGAALGGLLAAALAGH